MNGGSITGNAAPAGQGGGIFLIQAGVSISGSNPTGPVATNSFVSLNNGTISGNSANIGGGIAMNASPKRYWNGEGTWGETKISNVTITDNRAETRAGGMEMTPGNVVHLSDYVYISGNTCTAASNHSDVALRNTDDEYINETGIFIIDDALAEGSLICVDTLFKAAQPSAVKALVATGTDVYDITDSDYEKFVCTNSDYALLLDTDENCIWLMEPGPVVTFDTQGGSVVNSVMVMPGKTVAKPEDPTRGGYDFVGWYTSEDDGTTLSDTEYDFETPVIADITLYAKWTRNASGGSSTPRGNITLTKIDAEDASLALSGVVFKLYKADGTLYGTYTTDKDGKIHAAGLRTGKYYFVETKSADGYILDDTKHAVEVIRSKTTELTVTNTKTDSGNIAPVYTPGAFRADHIAYISGYDDNTVRPEADITRAEVAIIFYRLLNDETREKYYSSENNFSDVDDARWFNEAVSTMTNMGVIKGYPNDEFKPNDKITRAEFAAIVARFDDREMAAEDYRFEDMKGHWAEKEVARAVANGWILGYEDNTFRAENHITRAEAITLINRVLQRTLESKEDLLDEMIVWVDNADENKWYYVCCNEYKI